MKTNETGWLIEANPDGGLPWWLGINGSYEVFWTGDASKALRFARKEDAILYMHTYGFQGIATEHMWYGEDDDGNAAYNPTDLAERWGKSGLLDGLKSDQPKDKMAILLESKPKELLSPCDRPTATGRPAENACDAPVPTNKKLHDGQFADHWVLSEEDRKQGFVRPVRIKYVHVGITGPQYSIRNLTDEENMRWNTHGKDREYAKYEEYPKGSNSLGMFWTQEKLDKIGKGCGVVTSMPLKCAETYAVTPNYDGSTFCCGCNAYLPVG